MNTNQQLNMRAILSTTWIFFLLNMLVRDIHEFARPGYIEELMTAQVTEPVLLIAGIILELPIAMVLLSRILPYRINRWANMIIGAFIMVIALSFGWNDLDDMWFLSVEVIGLLFIIWSAWRWTEAPSSNAATVKPPQATTLTQA